VRGLVTLYTVFVIELHLRRVHVLGSTPCPGEAFVVQTMRHLTDDVDGVLRGNRSLTQLNGVPRSLWASTYARIASRSWGMLVWDPRLSARSVSSPKNRSTRFSHDA
jgi:hypothetical protein